MYEKNLSQQTLKFLWTQDVNDIKFFTNLAKENNLYINGWLLLIALKNPHTIKNLAVCYPACGPLSSICSLLGIAIYMKNCRVMIFVKNSHRKQGIGRDLIEMIRENNSGKIFKSMDGINGSDIFWDKTLFNGNSTK